MSADRQSEEDSTEDLSRLKNHTVKNYAEGVILMAVAMVENARDAAKRGDTDAQEFLRDWQKYFGDRHHSR